MEKREPSSTVGGNVNWCSCYGKEVRRFLKKLKIEQPYDQAIPLLGIHLEMMKTLILKNTFTLIFIAALFTYSSQYMEVT